MHLQFEEFLKWFEVNKAVADHIKLGMNFIFEKFNESTKVEVERYEK